MTLRRPAIAVGCALLAASLAFAIRRPSPPSPTAPGWTDLPVLRPPFDEFASIREQLAMRYREATHVVTRQECFGGRPSSGPPRDARLVLHVEASQEGLYVADALIEAADGITSELADCFVRTHRRIFLDVHGATPGRFRIEWPISY